MTSNWSFQYTLLSMIKDPSSPEELNSRAIDSALNCRWEEAVSLNQQLLKLNPESTESLNRLAKAYFELGKYSTAKKTYNEVLKIDPYNAIAQKNLKKVSSIKKSDGDFVNGNNHSMTISPALFLEEPGITTLVNLVKVAEPQKLLTLSPGAVVNLIEKKRGISVSDSNNQYLGAFPDDSAYHLLKLLKGGNKYQVIIKSVRANGLTILIREIYRSKRFRNQASFLDESKVVAYSSDNISIMSDGAMDDAEDQAVSEDIMS